MREGKIRNDLFWRDSVLFKTESLVLVHFMTKQKVSKVDQVTSPTSERNIKIKNYKHTKKQTN